MYRRWNWQAIISWACLVWLTVLVIGYFVYHKPIGPNFIVSLFRISWQTAAGALIVSLSGGLGTRLLPRTTLHPLAQLSIQAALGLGLFGLGYLAIGYLGWIYTWISLAALLLMGLFLWRETLTWWKSWGSIREIWISSSRIGRVVGIMALVILASTWLVALAPPIKFDALVYHLVLPSQYISAHQISYLPNNMYWGMPQTAEMLYTTAMSLGGDSASVLLGWYASLVALIGLTGFMAQKLGPDSAWIGSAALLSGFTIASSLAWGYNDWWTILFGTSFFYSLVLWKESRRGEYLALAGVFAGFALGTKYPAGILLISGLVVIWLSRPLTFRAKVVSSSWFGFSAILVFSPWLIKNLLATGNPIYPLLFPGGAMSAFRLAHYQSGQPWGNWLDVLLLPIRATWWGVEGVPGYSASIGPLLLGLGLAAGLGWRYADETKRSLIGLACQLSISAILLWIIASRFSPYLLQSRLYLSIFPVLTVLAAAGYSNLAERVQGSIRFRMIAGTLVLMVLGLTATEVALDGIRQRATSQILGLTSAKQYLSDNLGWYTPAMESLKGLPKESRALLLFEPRSYYCLPVCEPDEILDRWLRERNDEASGSPVSNELILQEWEAAGFTHLLFYRTGAEFLRQEGPEYSVEDWSALEELLDQLDPIETFGETYILYSLDK